MEGWIKLHRQLLTNGWFENHNLLVFWIYCLLKATHKPMTATIGYQEIPLQPGQFIFGRRKAAEETGLSEKQIRQAVKQTENRRMVAIKRASKFSIVSIVNWEAYQGVDTEEGPAEGPTKGQQRATYKNDKNKKNIYSREVLEVLSYLNQKTGRHYRDASNIEARLRDGGKVEECKAIIDKKLKDEHFIENPKYLNPETLFRKSHWDKYLNEPSAQEVKPTW